MPERQRAAPARRRVATPRLQLLVFTEGERTEDDYLIHWRRMFREGVVVTVDSFHGVPLSLVERAVAARRRETAEQRRGRGSAHDEVWCVFDQDAHPNVSTALEKAAANGIGVVLSNPCIELWFVLHHADQTAYLDRVQAQQRSRELLGCDKALTAKALEDLAVHYPEAKRRAQALDAKHAGDGSPARSNPSSDMWRLVDRIRGT